LTGLPDSSVRVILVKHAQPVVDYSRPAREWRLGAEGVAQAHRLAAALRSFSPLRLVSSPEPKAVRTSEVVASELAVGMTIVHGLREIDRPVLPILSTADHQAVNERLFTHFDEPVLGTESARAALDRFDRAVSELIRSDDRRTLVVVAHGTVISLFVAAHSAVDSFKFWKALKCSSFVVLDRSLRLIEVVEVM
jgi:broad specificity phosphatase PhoE